MSIATASVPARLSLKDAIVLAMRFNPDVQSSDLQRIIDRLTLASVKWQYDVNYALTGSAAYTRTVSGGHLTKNDTESLTPQATLLTPTGTILSVQMNNPLSNATGPSRYYNPSIQFSLTQPLMQGSGRDVVLAPLHLAENTEAIAALTHKNTLMQTVTDVISAWLSYLQAQNSLSIQRLSLQNSLATLRQQESFLKAGRIAPVDLVQFKATVAEQRLQLSQQVVSLGQQKRALLIILGLNPDLPVTISDQVDFPGPATFPLQKSIQSAFIGNVAWQQAKIGIKQSEINLITAKDAARWKLNFSAARTQGGGSGGGNNAGFASLTNGSNNNTAVGLSLTVPVDNVPLNNAVSQASITLQQQKIALEQLRRRLESEVMNTWNTVMSQKEQIRQAELAVKLAADSLSIAQTRLKFGKVTPFEVSTLQTNLTTQQINAVNVRLSYIANQATLDLITGKTLERWGLQYRK